MEACRLARQTKSRREKDALYGMARAWETLAKYIERYEQAHAEATKDAD
jgi:predicted secreted Zn-dependent protease